MKKLRTVLAATALAGAIALGACDRGGGDAEELAEDDALTATNGAVEVPLEDTAVEAIPETETPAPAPVREADEPANASVVAPPPADPIAEEQQIADDAEASGMTSRLQTEDEQFESAETAANQAE